MKFKETIIKIIIGSLVTTGLIAIFMILFEDANEVSLKIMGTTWIIATFGITSLIHIKLLDKNKYTLFATSSLIVMLLSLLSSLLFIWEFSIAYEIPRLLSSINVYSSATLLAGLLLIRDMPNEISTRLVILSAISVMTCALAIIMNIFDILTNSDVALKLFLISLIIASISYISARLITTKKN